MGGKVVEDDDVARSQFGTGDVLEMSGEDVGIDRAFDEKGSGDALHAQGRNEG